jgi:hypothetical protein
MQGKRFGHDELIEALKRLAELLGRTLGRVTRTPTLTFYAAAPTGLASALGGKRLKRLGYLWIRGTRVMTARCSWITCRTSRRPWYIVAQVSLRFKRPTVDLCRSI